MAAMSARVDDLTKFSERFPLSTLMQLPRPDELFMHKIPDFPLLMLFNKQQLTRFQNFITIFSLALTRW